MAKDKIKPEGSQPQVTTEVDEKIKSEKEATIIGLSPNLEEGKEYVVSGSTAYNLIQKGYAKLK
jgi:hypothetical protein